MQLQKLRAQLGLAVLRPTAEKFCPELDVDTRGTVIGDQKRYKILKTEICQQFTHWLAYFKYRHQNNAGVLADY